MVQKKGGEMAGIKATNWFTLAATNPRAAITVGAGIIVLTLSYVIINLYNSNTKLYYKAVEAEENCNKEKIEIINTYIISQNNLIERYNTEIKTLYQKVADINKNLK